MSEIEGIIPSDETIIYQARPSWLNYYFLYLVGIAFFAFFNKAGDSVGGIFALFFIIGLAAIFRFRYQFTITDNRLIMRL
jgi:hypothetical protein